MIKSSKIYVAGHRGMVGSALWRELESNGYTNLIGKNKNNLNLTNQQDVLDYIELEKPRIIINA